MTFAHKWDGLNGFQGTYPRVNDFLLSRSATARARNVMVDHGVIEALPCPELVDTNTSCPDGIKAITCEPCSKVACDEKFEVQRAWPAGDDDYRMFLMHEGGQLYMATEEDYCAGQRVMVGLPQPPAAPVVTATGDCSCGTAPIAVKYSIITGSAPYQQESALSPATQVTLSQAGSIVTVTLPALPAGAADSYRIYSTMPDWNDGEGGGTNDASSGYYLVGEGQGPQITFESQSCGLGALAPNHRWFEPPRVCKLVVDDNGVAYAVNADKPREIWFSEPHIYYGWSPDRVIITDKPVVDLVEYNNRVAVLTEGPLGWMQYDCERDTVVYEQSSYNMPAISARATGIGVGGIIFPSTHGLVAWDVNSAPTVVSDTPFGWAGWRDINPEDMRGFLYHGRYFGFPADPKEMGFMLQLGDNGVYPTERTGHIIELHPECIDPIAWCFDCNDILHFVDRKHPERVYKWDWSRKCKGPCGCDIADLPDTEVKRKCHPCDYDVILPPVKQLTENSVRALWIDKEHNSGDVYYEVLSYDCGKRTVVFEGKWTGCDAINLPRPKACPMHTVTVRLYGCGKVTAVAVGTSKSTLSRADAAGRAQR